MFLTQWATECFLKLIALGAVNIIHDHEAIWATKLLFFLICLGRRCRSGTWVKRLWAREDLKRMTLVLWRKEEGRSPVQTNIKGSDPFSWLAAWTEHDGLAWQACMQTLETSFPGVLLFWSANTSFQGIWFTLSFLESLDLKVWHHSLARDLTASRLATWPEGTW